VQLLNASHEVLDADSACWAYSPSGKAMPQVDIAEEIKKQLKGWSSQVKKLYSFLYFFG